MHDIIPESKIVKTRHKVSPNLAVGKAFDRICNNSKNKHIGKHVGKDRGYDHVNPAHGRGGFAERKEHEHHCAEEKARFELEGIHNCFPKIAESKTLTDRGASKLLRSLLGLKLCFRLAHPAADRTYQHARAERFNTFFTEGKRTRQAKKRTGSILMVSAIIRILWSDKCGCRLRR